MLFNQPYVNTVADLRALDTGATPQLALLGYHKPHDGGGGSFYWDESSTEPENGGTCLIPQSNPERGRWKRVWRDRISVKAFGAIGDDHATRLKDLFPTLSSAQAIYPHATNLDHTLDWTAIQAALNQLKQGTATSNHSLVIPSGVYHLSDTLESPNSASYWTLSGTGKLSTLLRWAGNAGHPMLKLTNARSVVIKELGFYGNTSKPPSHGILVHRSGEKIEDPAPQDVTFERILIANHHGERYEIGIAYTAETDHDSNNEQGHFIDVDIHNANQYGLSFEHSNSLLHRIYGGRIEGFQAAINNVGPNGTQGGSFQVFGASLGLGSNPAPQAYALRLGTARYPIQINGAAIESHGGLLATPYRLKDHTIVQFIGGAFHIGDTTTPSIQFDADENSLLEMIGVFISSAYGIDCEFPTSGSTAIFRDVRMATQKISYNNQVVIEKSWNSVGIDNFDLINLGEGKLKIIDSTGTFSNPNFNRFDLMKQQSLDPTAPNNHRTPSVQGLDYYEADYPTAVIITNFLHGFPGKAFSLISHNANITIKHNNNIWLKNDQDLLLPAKTHIRFQQASNGVWIQS